MRLAIGLPVSDEKVHWQFMLSFLGLERPDDCRVVVPKAQFHPANLGEIRTGLCKEAMELNCTHILFMDTDQVYHDTDLITRLIAHDKDIVGGKVHRRYPPFEPILNVDQDHVSDEVIDKGGLVEVDTTGTGCLLIKLSVLEDIERPWFKTYKKEDGTTVGEDIGFCYSATKAGYKIFVDCDVNIGHLALIQVNDSIYRLWKKINKVR